jgi:glycosyltransferase involved in cell wall biosynthesis
LPLTRKTDTVFVVADPIVSVILPTYNRAGLLREAIDSVRRQTFRSWELVVVDDGSTDATGALLAGLDEPNLRALRTAHSGNPARARNVGLAEARGQYVAFLDDDDLWLPEKLAVQLPLLTGGDFRWSYTGFISMNARGEHIWQTPLDRIPTGRILEPLLELRAAVALPTVIAERTLIEGVGGFDEAMRTREDYALWLELAARAEVAASPAPLVVVRDHAGRVFRPEGYRVSVALYERWFARLTHPRLRRICRRRIADSYLVDARYRFRVGQKRLAAAGALAAVYRDPRYAFSQLLLSLQRRLAAWAGRMGARSLGQRHV